MDIQGAGRAFEFWDNVGLGGEVGSEIIYFCWTSFMHEPLFEYIDTLMPNGINDAVSTAKFHGQGAEK